MAGQRRPVLVAAADRDVAGIDLEAMMPKRRLPAVVLLAALALLVPLTQLGATSIASGSGALHAAVAAAPGAPGFHQAVPMPGSSGGTEPSLAISNGGYRYVSWQSPGEFAGSADGVTFTQLGTPDAGAAGDVTNAVSASGALYNAQICGGATELHSCVYRSLDSGAHWTTQNILADNHPGASDRPWIDVYPKTATTATAS